MGLGALMTTGYVGDVQVFYCPSAESMPPDGTPNGYDDDGWGSASASGGEYRGRGVSNLSQIKHSGGYDGYSMTHGLWNIGGSLWGSSNRGWSAYDGNQGRAVQSHYAYRLVSSHIGEFNWPADFADNQPVRARVRHTRPDRVINSGEPIFKTQRHLQGRAVVADAFAECGAASTFPLTRPAIGWYGHKEGYNVLYGDWHTKWYGDPQRRLMYRQPLHLSYGSYYGAWAGSCNNVVSDWTDGEKANGDPVDCGDQTNEGPVYLWHLLDEDADVDVGVNR